MPPTNPTLVAFLLLVALVAAAPAQGVHRDALHGFEVKTIKDWNAVPVPATERYLVARWASERDIRDLPAQMLVYVFDKNARDPFATETDGPRTAGTYDGPEEAENPWAPKRSFQSFVRSDFERKGMDLGTAKPYKPKAPAGVDAKGQVFESSRDSGYTLGGRPVGGYYVVVATIDTAERQLALEIFVAEREKRKYQGQMLAVAKSFGLVEAAAPAPASTEPLSPREEARQRARADAERIPGWWWSESEDYFIVTNVPEKRRPFIDELKNRLVAIRAQYEKDFPPAQPIAAISIVRVCEDEKSYHDYGGPSGSAGYWFAPAKELVLYAAGEKDTTRAVLNHEAFHQYIHYACGEISPHSWYNEGYGDYYSGAEIQGRRVLGIDPFRWRQDTIRGHVRAGTHVPLKEIVRYEQHQYYARADLCYAQGWSMIYFLNKGVPAGHPWRAILPTYLKVIQETGSREKAVDAAFKDVDFAALEDAWAAFTTRGTPVPAAR